MPLHTRSPRSRPASAPAYYLARPATVWITAVRRQPPGRPVGSGNTFPPEREHLMNRSAFLSWPAVRRLACAVPTAGRRRV
jgi:hypothetical protein